MVSRYSYSSSHTLIICFDWRGWGARANRSEGMMMSSKIEKEAVLLKNIEYNCQLSVQLQEIQQINRELDKGLCI